MRYNLLLLFMLITFVLPSGVFSKTKEKRLRNNSNAPFVVAFVKAFDLKQFNDVVTGFKDTIETSGFKGIEIKELLMTDDLTTETGVANFIATNKPNVIICLGSKVALSFAKYEKKIPLIFSLVLNHARFPALKQSNIVGISMEVPTQSILLQFKLLCDKLTKLAIPYNPKASQDTVDDSVDFNTKYPIGNVVLIPIPVENPSKLVNEIVKRKDEIDSIWMIPDFKLYTRENISAVSNMFKFSLETKKPVLVAASEEFLKSGGLLSISLSYKVLGSQLFIMATKIGNGVPLEKIGVAFPFGTKTVLNSDVADTLFDIGIFSNSI